MRGRFEGGMLRAPRRGGAERPRPGAGSTSCASAWTLPAAARTILRTNACRSLPRHFSVCWYDAAMSDRDPLRLIWIDLEMTGLKPDSDHIIEIATIVTDKHLNTLAEGPVLAIHQSDAVLDAMDDWNRRQHGTSGLAARVRASPVTAGAAGPAGAGARKPDHGGAGRARDRGFSGALDRAGRLADVRQQYLPGPALS